MEKKVKLTEYNGIEIYVDAYGTFGATFDGIFVNDVTLERLKLKIEAEKKAEVKAAKLELACYGLHLDSGTSGIESVYSVVDLTLVGINRNDSSLRFKGHDGKGIMFAVPKTDGNAILLQDLAAAENARVRLNDEIRTRRIEASKWGGRIQPTEYAERIKRLQDSYAEAMKVSAEAVNA